MSNIKRITLIVLALIGIALSVELINVYIAANFVQDATPSICSINEVVNCDGVARTVHSQFLGVPLACWGLLLYLFILLMTLADKLAERKWLKFFEVFKNPPAYIFCFSLLAFVISMGLACLSFFEIKMVCIFCFMTYILDFIIVLVAKDYKKPIWNEIVTSIKDFVAAIKIKPYAIAFSILIIAFSGLLSYLTISAKLAPQLIEQREIDSFIKDSFNSVNGNVLGDENAQIIIEEFIDYNCGGCYLANMNSHRAVLELSNVRIIQRQLPLDKTCNPHMLFDGHKNSCLKAKYALAAAKQNKFWNMNDLLMFKSPETEEDIIKLAQAIKLDMKKLKEDVNSEEVANELLESIEKAESLHITGTPTLFVGIKQHTGAMSYPELKMLLIQMGAKERQ